MRIRRIRYCAPYQVEDDNEFIPEAERPRMVWRTWREVSVYDDVELRQLDHAGQAPNLKFQLRIPMRDPETQSMRDADGDQALLRICMVGAEMTLHGGLTVKGFVSQGDLLHEKEYRAGNLEGCLSARDRYDLDNEYVCEEWQEQ